MERDDLPTAHIAFQFQEKHQSKQKRGNMKTRAAISRVEEKMAHACVTLVLRAQALLSRMRESRAFRAICDQRGDVPGWVLVVLMTTGLVTAIWTIAAPRLTAILRNSLDSMNGIR